MATPFGAHVGIAAPILIDNIDTDQIIPSREMRSVGRSGLAAGLFAGWRYADPLARSPSPEFVLNQPAYTGATILLAGANFGCGSSREHAVWALAEFGIRAIVAPSFGEIFYNNCTRNGVLPVSLAASDIQAFASHVAQAPQVNMLRIDLHAQSIAAETDPRLTASFEIAHYPKRLLLEGLDPIGLTLTEAPTIEAFLARDRERRPWIYLSRGE